MLLDCLGRDSLVRLIYERGLPTSRRNDDRSETLARSYRGDVATLINDLSQADLVEVFRKLTFEIDGVECYLSNPGKYRRDDLRTFATKAFAGEDVPLPAPFTRLEVEESDEADEVDESDDAEPADEDDADEGDRAFSSIGADWSRPRKITRVMRRLGWRVPGHLRTERFQQLIEELRALGLEACLADEQATILDEASDSPRISSRIRLRRRDSSTRGSDAREPEQIVPDEDVDLSDAQPLLEDEKVAHLSLNRDARFIYFIKERSIWAVPRADAKQAKAKAKKVASFDLHLDHDRFLYFIDADGDLARKERAPRDVADPTVSLLGWAVIHSDGIVDPREVAELRRTLQDNGQTKTGAENNNSTLEAAITVVCAASLAVKERLVGQLFRIATADGLLADEEVSLLKKVEQRLLPGSELLTTMIDEWRAEHAEPAEPQTRGSQLIDDILSILQTSTQWQH